MSTNLAIRKDTSTAMIPRGEEWQAMIQQAGVLVKSGFLPDTIKTPEQALAIMLKGRELGVPPMVAIGHIHVIKGQPSCAVQLQLALCYERIPGFKCEAYSTHTDATAIASRPGGKPYKSYFTLEDAKRAGLMDNKNWQRYPRIMLEWRAIGHALKVVAPDAIMGLDVPGVFEPVVYEEAEGMEVHVTTPPDIQDWQRKKIHQEKTRCFGDDDAAYRRFLEVVLDGKTSTAGVSFEEAGRVLNMFGQIPDHASSVTQTSADDVGSSAEYEEPAEGLFRAGEDMTEEEKAEAERLELVGWCKEKAKSLGLKTTELYGIVEKITSKKMALVNLDISTLRSVQIALEEETAAP